MVFACTNYARGCFRPSFAEASTSAEASHVALRAMQDKPADRTEGKLKGSLQGHILRLGAC